MGISEGRIYEERSGKGFSDARAIKIAGAMGSIKRLVDNPWDYESIKRRVLLRILAILNLKMLGLEDFPKFRKTDSLQESIERNLKEVVGTKLISFSVDEFGEAELVFENDKTVTFQGVTSLEEMLGDEA